MSKGVFDFEGKYCVAIPLYCTLLLHDLHMYIYGDGSTRYGILEYNIYTLLSVHGHAVQ